jgi:Domain of unknown function (DUF6265)
MTLSSRLCHTLFVLLGALPVTATAQYAPPVRAPAPVPAPAAAKPPSLEQFAWLAGCWEGKVNQRDFREEWLPLRGEIMIGASQTAMLGKTLSFEFLRLEPRPDAVYYIPMPSGRKDEAFKMVSRTTDGEDELFTFENVSPEFPQQIIYRHAVDGWLYAHVGGKVNGEAKEVIYPMRHVDCQTGTPIRK